MFTERYDIFPRQGKINQWLTYSVTDGTESFLTTDDTLVYLLIVSYSYLVSLIFTHSF